MVKIEIKIGFTYECKHLTIPILAISCASVRVCCWGPGETWFGFLSVRVFTLARASEMQPVISSRKSPVEELTLAR